MTKILIKTRKIKFLLTILVLQIQLANNSGYSQVNHFLNVKEFGAKGNGSTDDTKSLQKAINFANNHNRILYIPYGIYLISSTIIQNSNQIIIGENSEIKTKVKGINIWHIKNGKKIGGGKLENIYINGDKTAKTGLLIGIEDPKLQAFSAAGFITKNVTILYCENGVQTGGSFWASTFENCRFAFCNIAFHLNGMKDSKSNNENISFSNCLFYNSNYGLKIENYYSGGGSVFANSCSFDYCTNWCIQNGTNPQAGSILTLNGCHVESEQKYIVNYGTMTIIGTMMTNGTNIGNNNFAIENNGDMCFVGGAIFKASGKSIYNRGRVQFTSTLGLDFEYNIVTVK